MVLHLNGTSITGRRPVVNVKDAAYGAAGNGTTDDTAALGAAYTAARAAGLAIYLPAGTYKTTSALDWRGGNLQVFGDGPTRTIIRQFTDNTPVMKSGGDYNWLEGFALQFNTEQPVANDNANCLEINSGFMNHYRNLSAYRGKRGVYIPQVNYADGGTATFNCVFSSVFDSIEILLTSFAGFDLSGFNGNCTGNLYDNIYIHNKEGSTYRTAQWGFHLKNHDEASIRQVNIEHGAYSQPFALDTVRVADAGALHFEDVRPGLVTGVTGLLDPSGCGFINVTGGSEVNIRSARLNFNVLDNTASALTEFVVLRLISSGPDVEIDALYEVNTTKTNSPTFRKVKADSTTTVASVRLGNYTATGATSASFDALSASRTRPLVRKDGHTLKHLVMTDAALSASATTGAAYLPAITGTPTGVPTVETGANPAVFDATVARLWMHDGTSWKHRQLDSTSTVAAAGASRTLVDNATVHDVTLTANCTLTLPTPVAGARISLVLRQGGAGSFTVTWPGNVAWSGGTAPTLSTAVAAVDRYDFVCADGTNWIGLASGTGSGGSGYAIGAWQTMSLTGFATRTGGYGAGQYRLEGTDVVRFQGSIAASTTYTSGVTICTLSTGYRPSVTRVPVVRTQAGLGSVQIATDGTVSCTVGLTSTQYINLDGIVFTL